MLDNCGSNEGVHKLSSIIVIIIFSDINDPFRFNFTRKLSNEFLITRFYHVHALFYELKQR